MLTEDEERYIQKIPKDKIVSIKPFDIREKEIAENIISKIKVESPNLEVVHMGASGLGISGQGDLGIYALADSADFNKYLPMMKQLFGDPVGEKPDSVAWKVEIEGYPVELYLTDPNSPAMKSQIKVFEKLRDNPALLIEYEKLKAEMDGKFFREYQRKKYEFYHRILD